MATGEQDPYRTLGVGPEASDTQLRAAYRRLVQLHHPDHNGGSAESARRFEAVQNAYARVTELRRSAPRTAGAAPPVSPDPGVESRIADLERELRAAQEARERARRAAREAAAAERRSEGAERPSDEELGFVSTDDSFSRILSDARSELADRLADGRERPVARRVGDLLEELEGLVSKLTDPPKR